MTFQPSSSCFRCLRRSLELFLALFSRPGFTHTLCAVVLEHAGEMSRQTLLAISMAAKKVNVNQELLRSLCDAAL